MRSIHTARVFGIAICFAILSLWSTSDLLRKNDQATILAGAHDWARGERQDWSRYYQFDKTYILYAYTAAFLKGNRALGEIVDPIRLGNHAVASAFWLALFVFIARFRRTLSPLALCAVLASPAVLFNTQYVNSTTLSSAFLLLALATFNLRWPRILAASFFLFLAVGSRADVILLLPLWFGLVLGFPTIASRRSVFAKADGKIECQYFQQLRRAVASSRRRMETPFAAILGLGSAALAALLVGRFWADGGGTTLDPFFQWKMALGYIAFGFGGAALLFVIGAWGVWRASEREGRWIWALTVLLPVLFFLPQLHAPRYFWRGAEAVLMVSALAPACLTLRNRWWRGVIWVAVLSPLLVGLSLPSLSQPGLTARAPTLFPSGDGHYPMGAYASFLGRMRQGSDTPIDHNQRVWAAVRAAEFEPDESGRVPVLFTPMYGYFMLEASLRGWTADHQSYAQMQDAVFYMDSRTLMRRDVKFGDVSRDLLDRPMTVVSTEQDGIAVLRVGAGDQAWAQRTRLLNRLFAGNEYRVVTDGSPVPRGHSAVWFAGTPFEGSTQDAETGWYYSRSPADTEWMAVTALPGWMSVQAFAGEGN